MVEGVVLEILPIGEVGDGVAEKVLRERLPWNGQPELTGEVRWRAGVPS